MDPSKQIRLGEIVLRLGGELIGDPDIAVRRIATLQSAVAGDISFLSRRRYRPLLDSTRASAVILQASERDATALPRIICDDPYAYYARLSALIHPAQTAAPGVHATAVVEPGGRIAPSASVGPHCAIGRGARLAQGVVLGPGCMIGDDCEIGDDSRLHAGVTLYAGCRVGRRALIHSGAVIGADGFGLAMHEGRWIKIPQIGGVVIGDDVEIGANPTIDRGALDDTVIEDGVKLDNQIQVGHNVRIGAHTAMAGCVGIAGSARIGRYCTVGGGAVILGHLEIADHVNISAASLVTKSITAAGTYTGAYPLQPNRDWGRTAALLRNLQTLAGRVKELEKAIARLSGGE